jgi:hypothetical protein
MKNLVVLIILCMNLCAEQVAAQNPALLFRPLQLPDPLQQALQLEQIRALRLQNEQAEAQRRFLEEQQAEAQRRFLEEQQAKERVRRETENSASQQPQQISQTDPVIEKWIKAAAPRMGLYQDFERVVFAPDVPITIDMIRLMTPSPLAADIAYHLGKNKIESLAISKMSLIDAARSIEAIEARLSSEAKQREKISEESTGRDQLSSPPQMVTTSNAHALVIGNAAYPGSARLDNPINDANAVAQKLRTMGFTVTVVTDANRQRLVQAMSNFRKTASSADLSLLFYSGHGVQIFGTNYILPTDADQTDVAKATIQGISLNSVVENFLPGKTKIVFLDACRDNPLQRTGDRSVSKGLAPISAAQGTLIAYATKDGQTASDGVGQKNSPFTTALLQHLGDQSDIAVILRRVREKVMTATGGRQQPWEYGSLTGGELVLSAVRR